MIRSLAVSGIALVTLVGCQGVPPAGSTGASAAANVDALTVSYWGGVWGDAYTEAAFDPFAEASGIDVNTVTGAEGGVTILEGEVEKSEPAYDIIFLSEAEFATATERGLLAEIDQDSISNWDDLYDLAKDPYGISSEVGSYGLMYNEEEVDTPPECWSDLLDPEFEGKFSFAPPNPNGEIFGLVIAALAGGASAEDAQEQAATLGVETAKELDENGATFTDFGQALALIQSGSISVAPIFSQEPNNLASEGLPVKYVLPCEGGFSIRAWMAMPSNLPAERKAAAEKFMDSVVSVESQEQIAAGIFSGPANKQATLSEELDEQISPYGQEEIDQLIQLDWTAVVEQQEQWVDEWNNALGQ